MEFSVVALRAYFTIRPRSFLGNASHNLQSPEPNLFPRESFAPMLDQRRRGIGQ